MFDCFHCFPKRSEKSASLATKIVSLGQSDFSSGDKSDVVLTPVFTSAFISSLTFGRNGTCLANTVPIGLIGFARQKTVQRREDTSFTTPDIGISGPV